MEVVTIKRGKARRKRGHLKRRRREQAKFEVKFGKRSRFSSERGNIVIAKEELIVDTMQASSFWENYTAAQEWQKRHSITWWKTRCVALERENQILRDKLRSIARLTGQPCVADEQGRKEYKYQNTKQEHEEISDEETENLEFQVNEDMMSFLEQSLRHKIELRKKRESELRTDKTKDGEQDSVFQGGAVWMHARSNDAKLLYGEASPTILAMETALQTTVDRHKDKAKPQYWPVIPLKP
ncbi:uncharacterized protein LOC143432812 [Xylocopa sonorina]|uniref:uncharacterized protein LOC143432812 n=1 Tax=Xylocopa sonorina TaxID=1818115 RepID=UPI00403AC459